MTTVQEEEQSKEWSKDEEAVLLATFKLLDVNQDNQVDFNELQMGMGKSVRSSVLVRAIESVDDNEDNMLNFDEFKELMKNPEIDKTLLDEEKATTSDEAELEKMLLGRLGKAMTASQDMRRSSMFGRVAVADESGRDLVKGLRGLDQELLSISDSKKKQYLQAKEKCPQLIGDKFKLMFLRAEEYDPKRAATRLVQYWEERVRIFGKEKAFLPLTQTQALHDDKEVLKHGVVKAINKKDAHGQTLVFIDFSVEKRGKFDGTAKARALWYVIHSILDDEDTQLKGVVYIAMPPPSLRDFDPKMLKHTIQSSRFYLPIRLACVHICHVPSFANMVNRVVNIFAGEFKHRRRMHRGTDQQVLDELESYGIPNDCVPTELAGSCQLDHLAWLEAKREAGL